MNTNILVSCLLVIALGSVSVGALAQAEAFNAEKNAKAKGPPNRAGVTSSGGSVRVNSATLAGDCHVISQTGAWVALFPRRPRPLGLAEGCTFLISSGEYSRPPACTCMVNSNPSVPTSTGRVDQWCVIDGLISENFMNLRVTPGDPANAVPADIHLICVGPH